MLYRLRPPSEVTWCDIPGAMALEAAAQHNADLDRLDWVPTEDRMFSQDLLRLALRYGVSSGTGIVLDVKHTLDLGRADHLRMSQIGVDEAHAQIPTESRDLIERLMPGSTAHGEALDRRVRESTERIASEADQALTEALAKPINPLLTQHWMRLGGDLPD